MPAITQECRTCDWCVVQLCNYRVLGVFHWTIFCECFTDFTIFYGCFIDSAIFYECFIDSTIFCELTVLCESLTAHPKCNDITTDLTSRESSLCCVVDRTDRIGQLVVGVRTSSHYGAEDWSRSETAVH